MTRAILFVNGELKDPVAARALLHPDDALIAADGGARHALALGVIPHVIIGDFDSLTEAEVRIFNDMGVHMLRYPTNKDETDLELALHHALQSRHNPITLIGALGGRLDQQLANLSLLTDPACLQTDIRIDDGWTQAFYIASAATLHGQPGDTLSLLPIGGPAEGVSVDGALYPLHKETLLPYRTRGISNQFIADTVRISIKSGLLLCIHQRQKGLAL